MERKICILTKSAKRGGYCVAAYDFLENRIIRIVSQNDEDDAIPKNKMYDINCLEIINVNILQNIPIGCQQENVLVDINGRFDKTDTIIEKSELFKILSSESVCFHNNRDFLTESEINNLNYSLMLIEVYDIDLYIVNYENKPKGKVRFKYKNKEYCFRITDYDYLNENSNSRKIHRAILVLSIPRFPFERNGFYYKFVAKIYEI